MLPATLEIYVVWHPDDTPGKKIMQETLVHFHGTAFSGLIGGAIEVFSRSEGWTRNGDSPKAIPFEDNDDHPGFKAAKYIILVPILGNALAAATQSATGGWFDYLTEILAKHTEHKDRVAILPYRLHSQSTNATILGDMLGKFQCIAANPPGEGETVTELRCRDLSQAIAQFIYKNRITVFLSHTKHSAAEGEEDVRGLIECVRNVVSETRLKEYFDASDLQPGQDWDSELRSKASTSAMLSMRTDLYPSRDWCQREISIAKKAGMPIVIMDAIGVGEERGSFLMDHMPRVPARFSKGIWNKSDVRQGLNLLVDECLKRALWIQQMSLAQDLSLEVSWWAPHAPELVTYTEWLLSKTDAGFEDGKPILVIHPDPPLGNEELAELRKINKLLGIDNPLEIMTPRLLAARGG